MNIEKAVKKASKKTKAGITRAIMGRKITIILTDTEDRCIIKDVPKAGEMIPRWNPTGKDILARDWEDEK